jgi:hypothetical protein
MKHEKSSLEVAAKMFLICNLHLNGGCCWRFQPYDCFMSIHVYEVLYWINNLQSNKELALPVYVTQLGNDSSLSSYAKEMKLIIRILLQLE